MKHPSSRRLRIWVGLGAALLALALARTDFGLQIERRTVDYRLRWGSSRWLPSPGLVVVELDDRTLQRLESEFGRWPWPRHVLADVIRYCSEAQAIVLDILLPEHDRAQPAGDAALVEACARHGRVIAAALLDDHAPPPAEALARDDSADPQRFALQHRGVLLPFAELLETCQGVGFVNCLVDDDGVLRSAVASGLASSYRVEALPVAAARHAASAAADPVLGPSVLRCSGRAFPLDERGRFLIAPRRSAHRAFSLGDVYDATRGRSGPGGPTPADFRGKIVFIGSTATGLQDDRYMTSLGALRPGVHIMASACDQLLNGPHLGRAPSWSGPLLVILLALLPAWLPGDRPRIFVLAGAFALALLLGGGLAALPIAGLLPPLLAPALGLVLSLTLCGGLLWRTELRRRRDLEALESVKQQFTDMLVHDLRNQTGPIMMALSLLEQRSAQRGEDEEVKWIRTAHASTERLVGQVDNLLDIRRMEEGRLQLQRGVHSLRLLIEEALRQYQPAADRAAMRLVLLAPADADDRVNVDTDLMNRVLGNLIWNAVKYGRETTDIEITIERAGGDVCALSIRNRGEPIPAEDQGRLFAPFSMLARKPGTVKFRGSGLGLAFCRMAVEALGGQIQVESPWQPAGDGVLVRIRLPRVLGS